LLLTNGSYEDHIAKVQQLLTCLNKHNFWYRVDKCSFAVTAVEYLGYWLTRDGISPQPKKVEAIHQMTAPTNKKQLRCFLGMVNFYRDMWRQRSHILAPLTMLTSNKAIFEWTNEQQEAFEEIKRVMCQKTMLSFPDFSKEFHVYMDASDYQLGGVIMQDDKLLSAQMNYTTGKKELLSIVEILREF
jgi:hypothetical protein